MERAIVAKLKYMRISPRKARLSANILKKLSVNEAEGQLLLSPHRTKDYFLRLLRSAVANAKNNHKIDAGRLFVKDIRVDKGPVSKRWTPRARGSASKIEKKTSHITIVLGVVEEAKKMRFTIVEKKRKDTTKGKKAEHGSKEAPASPKSPKGHVPSTDAKKSIGEKKEVKRGTPSIFHRKAI